MINEKDMKGMVTVALKLRRSAKWNGEHKPAERNIIVDLPREEYMKWILNDKDFITTYIEWVKSKYDPKMKPSLDRIDTTIGYILSNVTITSWEQNHRRQVLESRKGVTAFYSDGTKINYPGVRPAKRSVGYNIQPFLLTGDRDKHGILWAYQK